MKTNIIKEIELIPQVEQILKFNNFDIKERCTIENETIILSDNLGPGFLDLNLLKEPKTYKF